MVLTGLVVVAGAVIVIVLVSGRNSNPPAARTGPLRVGPDVAVKATPDRGGCGTTFTFRATGSLEGVGKMVYRWEQSDGRTTPELSINIDSTVGSFDLHQAWRLEGAQQVDGGMTFHVLRPTSRLAMAKISYTCA